MSATGKKTHRRTLSLSQGNNSDTSPPIDTKTPMPNTSNNHLSVAPEKIRPLTPPPTPSKQRAYLKFFPRKKNRRREGFQFLHAISSFSFRNILFTIIFCTALVVFLASLSGIGPVDDDSHYTSPKKQPQKVKPLHIENQGDSMDNQKVTNRIELTEKDIDGDNVKPSNHFNDSEPIQPNGDGQEKINEADEEEEKATDGMEYGYGYGYGEDDEFVEGDKYPDDSDDYAEDRERVADEY